MNTKKDHSRQYCKYNNLTYCFPKKTACEKFNKLVLLTDKFCKLGTPKVKLAQTSTPIHTFQH